MLFILKILNLMALMISFWWLVATWPEFEPVVTALGLFASFLYIEYKGYKEFTSLTSRFQRLKSTLDPHIYNKRKTIYDSLCDMLNVLHSGGKIRLISLQEIKKESTFLFGTDIQDYLDLWINNFNLLHEADDFLSPLQRKDDGTIEYKQAYDRHQGAIKFFNDQRIEIIEKFKPYLSVMNGDSHLTTG